MEQILHLGPSEGAGTVAKETRESLLEELGSFFRDGKWLPGGKATEAGVPRGSRMRPTQLVGAELWGGGHGCPPCNCMGQTLQLAVREQRGEPSTQVWLGESEGRRDVLGPPPPREGCSQEGQALLKAGTGLITSSSRWGRWVTPADPRGGKGNPRRLGSPCPCL